MNVAEASSNAAVAVVVVMAKCMWRAFDSAAASDDANDQFDGRE